jgi:hypothetical protein
MAPPSLRSLLLLCLCLAGAACKSKVEQQLFTPDAAKPLRADFSASKALAHVQAQVDFGPRPAGSEALGKCRAYLAEQLKSFGWDVQEQAFEGYTPKGNIKFTNLRARLPIAGSDTWNRPCAILLGSHFDTKLFGSFEFVGANDGGSSTGVLLEFARVLGARTEAGQFVELVFFDGEEAAVNYTMNEHTKLPDDGLYGSRHYVEEMRKLPSMVGDKDFKIEIPVNATDTLTDLFLTTAGELGFSANFGHARGEILDDHHPFLVSGIKSVDVIDLDFKPWHTSSDNMASISEQSLGIVGQTTLQVIEKLLSSTPKE